MSIFDPNAKVYVFKENGKYGVRDNDGWQILAPIHDCIFIWANWILVYDNIRYEWRYNEKLGRKIRYYLNGTTVIYNFDGTRQILTYERKPIKVSSIWTREDSPDMYDIISRNDDIVTKGVINEKGDLIVPPIYTYVDGDYPLFKAYLGGELKSVEDDYYKCTYVKDGRWKVIDASANKESAADYEVCSLAEGNTDNDILAEVLKEGVAGFLLKSFQFVEEYHGLKPSASLLNKDIPKYSTDSIYTHNIVYWREDYPEEEKEYGWTQEEIERAYRGAYEMDPSNIWNTD